MRYYPALLDLKDRICCVIGGGVIAERKAKSLLSAGARVEVISPCLTEGLSLFAKSASIAYRKDVYRKKYIRHAYLVIAATSDTDVNYRVSADAAALRIWVNVVDRPALSSFIVPAVLSKNGLIISISTSGKAPGLSKRIKKDLKDKVLSKYACALSIMAQERRRLKNKVKGFGARKKILARLADKTLGSVK